ncbi:radical SAM protein [Thermodesulfatator indicus]
MLRQASLFEKAPAIKIKPDFRERLSLLSRDSRFDLAGSCAKDALGQGRKRGPLGRWLYPVVLPNGRRMTLFRTLLSNQCYSDCAYCPLRQERDFPRLSLKPEEIAEAFISLWRRKIVHGLFLSSAIFAHPDRVMEKFIAVARILREKEGFGGYIHLKVIPGASEAAIEAAAKLANALSLNIEASAPKRLACLSRTKKFEKIWQGLSQIKKLKENFSFSQTTQFIVGAAGETDAEIIWQTEKLYRQLKLNRVYFSAYQPGLGREDLPGEHLARQNNFFLREHRLYQVDFLLRKYGFSAKEIPLKDGFLTLEKDPKELWAESNPQFFPVDVNRASYRELLRVPGIGPTIARRILEARKEGRLKDISSFFPNNKLFRKAFPYIKT